MTFEIELPNWNEYQIRQDVKSTSWFRLEHNIFDQDQFWDFSRSELCFFFYILCLASKQNSGTIFLNVEKAEVAGRFKKNDILSAIKKLESFRIVHVKNTSTLRERDVSVRARIATDRQTDITDRQTECVFDFEEIYKNYPNKIGKKKGIDTCKVQIKTAEDFEKLKTAVLKYAAHCRTQRIEAKFIKHFSTFMNSWTDWGEENSGKVEMPRMPVIVQKWVAPEPERETPSPEAMAKVRQLVQNSLKRM